MRLRGVSLAATVAALPAAAQACVIVPPSCELPSGIQVQLMDFQGDAVLVEESDATRSRAILVHCPSRQAVQTDYASFDDHTARDAQTRAVWSVMDMLHDDARQTLAEVQAAIRSHGVAARRWTAPAGYCGCDLPAIPFVGCPPLDDGAEG